MSTDKRHLYLPPQVDIWQVDPRPEGGPTAYYMVLVDISPDIQRKQVAFILNVDQKTGALTVEPYTPQDYDYTIHDGCDHENGYCYTETEEFDTEVYMDNRLAMVAHRLTALQEQLRQKVIAERLLAKQQQDHHEEEEEKRREEG